MKEESEGLGDLIEKLLNAIGITKERVTRWLRIENCGCEKRKRWLNRIFSSKKK